MLQFPSVHTIPTGCRSRSISPLRVPHHLSSSQTIDKPSTPPAPSTPCEKSATTRIDAIPARDQEEASRTLISDASTLPRLGKRKRSEDDSDALAPRAKRPKGALAASIFNRRPSWDETGDVNAFIERYKRKTVLVDEDPYSPLTSIATKRLRSKLNDYRNLDDIVAGKGIHPIDGQAFRRFNPGAKLVPAIVDYYGHLLLKRNVTDLEQNRPVPIIAMSEVGFYSALMQMDKPRHDGMGYDFEKCPSYNVDLGILDSDIFLIPVSKMGHCSLVVVDMKEKTLEHLDPARETCHAHVVCDILRWLGDEHADKGKSFDRSEWKFANKRQIPEQLDGSNDCGVFVCKYADFICRGSRDIDFTPGHVDYFRARIAHELLMGRVS